jgi:thiamine-monophosphate kinase
VRRRRTGEFERIRRIVRALPRGAGVVVGPGDDAAVLRPARGADLVMTTDAFVEGRHYVPGVFSPAAIGRRLAAANLSDLAAMAATPRWATIAACAPPGSDPAVQRAIERACARALARAGATVVGGNLSAARGPAWWVVTLLGEVARGAHWRRSGARAGDALAVTGTPGLAAAALAGAGRPHARVLSPPARVRAARAMAATGAVRAAIDLSDGLAGDLAHLCAASGVGAVIEAARLPVAGALLRLAGGRRSRAERWCLGPSDDYELLLAIDPARLQACEQAARAADAPLTVIGAATPPSRGLVLRRAGRRDAPLDTLGYDHYA